MWKKNNNFPVTIQFLCHCHSINWEKSWTCRRSCRSTRVISAFINRASCKSRAFIHAHTRNAQSVHCDQGFLRSLFMPCQLVINGIYDRLASNQKHPYIASMYERTFSIKAIQTWLVIKGHSWKHDIEALPHFCEWLWSQTGYNGHLRARKHTRTLYSIQYTRVLCLLAWSTQTRVSYTMFILIAIRIFVCTNQSV